MVECDVPPQTTDEDDIAEVLLISHGSKESVEWTEIDKYGIKQFWRELVHMRDAIEGVLHVQPRMGPLGCRQPSQYTFQEKSGAHTRVESKLRPAPVPVESRRLRASAQSCGVATESPSSAQSMVKVDGSERQPESKDRICGPAPQSLLPNTAKHRSKSIHHCSTASDVASNLLKI